MTPSKELLEGLEPLVKDDELSHVLHAAATKKRSTLTSGAKMRWTF